MTPAYLTPSDHRRRLLMLHRTVDLTALLWRHTRSMPTEADYQWLWMHAIGFDLLRRCPRELRWILN
jgi:hypothetical protein